ncbi:hypothetical protein JZU68_07460, partial [bacterium]|nr:hypothetical protein [bacterium]
MFNEQDRKNVERKLPPKGSFVKSVVRNKTIFSDGSVIKSQYLTRDLVDGILYDYSVKLGNNYTVITITLSFSYNDDRNSLPKIPIEIY